MSADKTWIELLFPGFDAGRRQSRAPAPEVVDVSEDLLVPLHDEGRPGEDQELLPQLLRRDGTPDPVMEAIARAWQDLRFWRSLPPSAPVGRFTAATDDLREDLRELDANPPRPADRERRRAWERVRAEVAIHVPVAAPWHRPEGAIVPDPGPLPWPLRWSIMMNRPRERTRVTCERPST